MMTLPVLTYTFLRDFESCPHKAFRRYVSKDVKFTSTEAMERGKKDHEALEHRIGRGEALPRHLRSADPICDIFDALPDTIPVRVEYFIGMKIDGSPCAWNDSDVWMRGKADVACWSPDGGWLIDWKTGNTWEDPFELNCQAMLCASHHGEVPFWKGEYFWLKEHKVGKRYDLDPMHTFARVVNSWGLMTAYERQGTPGAWPKVPGKLCNWCDILDCEHNPRKEKG
jgi:hypothetical protein